MKLSDHDLRQIDEERINKLSETAVKNLSITLLNDLKEARERLNQNSKNSSIPPSSEAPWDKASKYEDAEEDSQSSDDIEALDKAIHADKQALGSDCHAGGRAHRAAFAGKGVISKGFVAICVDPCRAQRERLRRAA